MAVSELNLAQLGATHRTAARLLFERLPDRLFAPLASPNRHQYWACYADCMRSDSVRMRHCRRVMGSHLAM
jgi:hypothetical protein